MKKFRRILLITFIIVSTILTGIYYYFDKESVELDEEIRTLHGIEFIESVNGYIHYESEGNGNSQYVVLIHGFSSPMQTWNRQFSTLVDSGFQVIRYDLFGRGYSDRPRTEYDLELFNVQLDALLSSLDINKPVDLIGLSLGSHIAADFALKHASKVRKIILLSPQITPLENRLIQLPFLGEFLMTTRIVPALKFFPEQKTYKGFRNALLSTMRNFSGIDPIPKYEKLTTNHEVALIWGDRDKNTAVFLLEKMKTALKNIEIFRIHNANHAVHFTEPDRVNSIIIKFLKHGNT
jgi:pimeloyl-ACP methyl ester carboxylesterase